MFTLSVFLLAYSRLQFEAKASFCKNGFVGAQCELQNHCVDPVNELGECISRNCEKGWFGFNCQYRNILNREAVNVTGSHKINFASMLDDNDKSCVMFIALDYLNITFSYQFSFSFISVSGLVLSDKKMTITLKGESMYTKKCTLDDLSYQIFNNVTDIYCPTSDLIHQIDLEFGESDVPKKICSLYVSKGRNLALGQKVSVSSVASGSDGSAINAINGITSPYSSISPCTQSDPQDQAPHFNLTFEVPVNVNDIEIYNREQPYTLSLNAFILKLYDSAGEEILRVQDSTDTEKFTYRIILKKRTNVKHMTIWTRRLNNKGALLSICEVELYGDCMDNFYGFDCKNACPKTCYKGCTIDGQCNYIKYFIDEPAVIDGKCKEGWYGIECQFKCNLEGGCHGKVDSKKCKKGWFGHRCQYQDLLTMPTTTVISNSQSPQTLIDYNDTSCIEYNELQIINVLLKQNYIFHFLRIHSPNVRHVNVTVELVNESIGPFNCDNNKKSFVIGFNQSDIYCQFNLTIKAVNIYVDANNSLCSIYLSGGRNVAYGQAVMLSSVSSQNLTAGTAQRAIDGLKGQEATLYGCSQSDESESDPYFELTFKTPRLITRIIIHNSGLQQARFMEHFVLELFNSKDGVILEHKDNTEPRDQFEYTVLLPPLKEPVKKIKVRATTKVRPHTVPILHICELEAFGDCPNGTWGYECNNTCPDHCEGRCNALDGSCLAVCMFNTILPDCHRTCPSGTYGNQCQLNCSVGCYTNNCHHATGDCVSGCNGYSDVPHCTKPCINGKYGYNCLLDCHHSCKSLCDGVTGECSAVCHGYSNPPECNQACKSGSYGTNCEMKCTHCKNQSCNHVTGSCTTECEGYIDFPICKKKCRLGTYGPKCNKRCGSECYLRQCNHITAKCDSGCESFQDPPRCQTPCANGHGLNCTCHDFCKRCELYSTLCAECKPGFKYQNVTKMCTTSSILWKMSDDYTEPEWTVLVYIPVTIFLLGVLVAIFSVVIFLSFKRAKRLSTYVEQTEDWPTN